MSEEHDPFDELVIRTMNGRATSEEVAYLEGHFLEHRAALVNIINRNKSLRLRVQAEKDADIFHEHELELEQRLAKAGGFIRRLEARLSELNAYGKLHPELKRPISNPTIDELKKKLALARIKGWGQAIHYFDKLLEEGLTRNQAKDACISYMKSEHNKLRASYTNKESEVEA